VNTQGIQGWEADSAPIAGITVDVSWVIDLDVTYEIEDGGFLYDVQHTSSGSDTYTFTFLREAFKPDDPTNVTTNAFSIGRGELIIPSPITGKFGVDSRVNQVAIPDQYPPNFRGCFCNVYPKSNTYENGPVFADTTNTYSVAWQKVYTPTDGGPPKATDSGTVTDTFGMYLDMQQIGDEVTWVCQGAFVNLDGSDAYPGYNGAANGSPYVGPVTVTVENLMKSGPDVDIGGTTTFGKAAPTNVDVVTTWTYDDTFTITCA
jgi:hypothetical protein